jgi:transposase-like protein
MEKSEEEQLLIRAMVRQANEKLRVVSDTLRFWQNHCTHPNVEKKHERVDGYSERPEFYTHFKCMYCEKQWTLEGSL